MTSASGAKENPATANHVLPLVLPEQTNPEIRKLQDRLYKLEEYRARYLLTPVHPWEKDPDLRSRGDANNQSVEWDSKSLCWTGSCTAGPHFLQ